MAHLRRKILELLDDAKDNLIEAWQALEKAEHVEIEHGEEEIPGGGGDAFDQIGIALKHVRLAKAQLRSFEKAEIPSSKAHEAGLDNPPPTHVQSIIFKKEHWTVAKARNWLKEHDKKFGKVDVRENTLRFRQRSPGDFQKGEFAVINFGEPERGIEAVVGHLKEGG